MSQPQRNKGNAKNQNNQNQQQVIVPRCRTDRKFTKKKSRKRKRDEREDEVEKIGYSLDDFHISLGGRSPSKKRSRHNKW